MTEPLDIVEVLRRPLETISQCRRMRYVTAEVAEIAATEIARLREERRWVPVGERLPEGNCKVLTLGLQRYPVVCSFFQFDQSFRDGGVVSGVTNWMPLPPGPEANG